LKRSSISPVASEQRGAVGSEQWAVVLSCKEYWNDVKGVIGYRRVATDLFSHIELTPKTAFRASE